MSVTDEIKARIDIVNYINQYVPLKKSGRYYKACCPFHSEKTPSFVVNADTQTWRCFGACADGGDIFGFAIKQHGWTFQEALEELGKQAGIEVKKQSPLDRQRAELHDKLRGLLQTAADLFHEQLTAGKTPEARAALEYARQKRGFTDDTIRQYQIGYAPAGWQTLLDDLKNMGYEQPDIIETGMAIKNEQGRIYDRFRNRLMIPIRDERGRVIGFGARALDPNDNPKYLNSPQTPLFDKSRVLFGLDVAKGTIRDTEVAVIVEGYMDAIQAHQAGFTNVVAQMGTAMTETQLKLIAPRYAKKIILALDSDAAGQSATRRSLEVARQTLEADFAGRMSVDIRVLQIPGAKDPDDLIREAPEQWQQVVNDAVPVADFVIEMETSGLSSDASISERETVARQMLSILTASENDLYKHDNIQKLARRLRIAERDLLAWASEEQRRNAARRQSSARADEPPPIDYESLEPPPDDDQDDGYAGVSNVTTVKVMNLLGQDASLEAHCLRMLILYPDAFFQINRRLRELAGSNVGLQQGPLSDFGVADFTHNAYRALMEKFLAAVWQHEEDVLIFLRETLDPLLEDTLNQLLADESIGVHLRLKGRHSGDFEAAWKQYERLVKPTLNPTEELLGKVLRLRLQRIRREMDEYSFMQVDAQERGDQTAVQEIGIHIVLSQRARHLLDVEVQQQLNYFM